MHGPCAPCPQLKRLARPRALPQAPAPAQEARKLKGSTQLTELDMQALAAKSAKREPPKLEWPAKRSFSEIAWWVARRGFT